MDDRLSYFEHPSLPVPYHCERNWALHTDTLYSHLFPHALREPRLHRRMATNEKLKRLLDSIPQERRGALDRTVEDGPILAAVAHTLPDWPKAANYFSGIKKPDVEAIKHDYQLSLEQQK